MADVRAATAAAARGGTTTALSFTDPAPASATWTACCAAASSWPRAAPSIDVGLHAMLYDPEREPRWRPGRGQAGAGRPR